MIDWKSAALALALLPFAIAHASEPCPDTRLNKEWSAACFETNASQRQVKQAYRHNLHFNRRGFATIRIQDPIELVAVNSQAVVAIPGIYFWGDFDFPNAHGGISRFRVRSGGENGKCGYFNDKTFAVIAPPIYDNCSSFQDGEATVCNGCVEYCTEPECQNSVFIGGDGMLTIDAKGYPIRTTKAVTLETACTDGARPLISNQGERLHLNCPTPSTSPFQMP